MRKTPVAAADVEIGKRIQNLRLDREMSREVLSARARVPVGVIARVEQCRMPLRYEDARKLFRGFAPERASSRPDTIPPNPLWLLTGAGDRYLDWPLILPPISDLPVRHNALFSEVMAPFAQAFSEILKRPKKALLPGSWLRSYAVQFDYVAMRAIYFRQAADMLGHLVRRSADNLARSSPLAARLSRELLDQPGVAGWFAEEYKLIDYSEKTSLTDGNKPSRVDDVKLKTVLARLEAAMKDCGGLSALARSLKMPKSTVSRYLSHERKPGADALLRIQEWLDRPGRDASPKLAK